MRINKKDKIKHYDDGLLSLKYPSYMKFKCFKKGGSYNLKIDRNSFISIAFFPKDCMDDFVQKITNCHIYNNKISKLSYLGEMLFGNNVAIVSVSMNHKLDGTFIEKRYWMLVTSIKTYCLNIEISGFCDFDIKDYSEIIESIKIAE